MVINERKEQFQNWLLEGHLHACQQSFGNAPFMNENGNSLENHDQMDSWLNWLLENQILARDSFTPISLSIKLNFEQLKGIFQVVVFFIETNPWFIICWHTHYSLLKLLVLEFFLVLLEIRKFVTMTWLKVEYLECFREILCLFCLQNLSLIHLADITDDMIDCNSYLADSKVG